MTPLVLVHGVGLDHHLWDSTRAYLSPARPVIAYDTLGHGDGPHRPGPYRLRDYVTQLDGVLGDAGVSQPVDLAGFSMGALVVLAYAIAQPTRVRRLVLLATVFDRTPAERTAVVDRVGDARSGGYARSIDVALGRWFSPEFAAARPEVVAAVRSRMASNDERAYADAYEVFATGDAELTPHVGEVTAPTLVVAGGDDARSTPAMARALAERMPNGRALVLDGIRHCLVLEAPGTVAHLIDDFLDDERSAP